jgi:putative tryptophan/tyrosine transport system substrate-binding protein
MGRRQLNHSSRFFVGRHPPVRRKLIDQFRQVLAEAGKQIVALHAGLLAQRIERVAAECVRQIVPWRGTLRSPHRQIEILDRNRPVLSLPRKRRRYLAVKRREFVTLLGSAAAASAWTIGARAQQNAPLVGFLNSASPNTYRFNADSFREGLAKAGFEEGRNVRIEERWARGDYEALPALAADLVSRGVVAIAATGDVASARAAQRASSTVPVVFTIGGDPVRFGLVRGLNRPGGHVTGILFNQNVLGAKRVELVRQFAPNVSCVALLMNPTNPNAQIEQADAEAGAKKLGLETITLHARNPAEIDTAFEQLLVAKADAFITATDPILLDRREQIVSFASRYRLPAVYFVRQFAAAGGVLSYGPSISWMYRQAGEYVGQILKGSNPAEMPVLQPTQFELVINIKTARALDFTVPDKLLALADEVIE